MNRIAYFKWNAATAVILAGLVAFGFTGQAMAAFETVNFQIHCGPNSLDGGGVDHGQNYTGNLGAAPDDPGNTYWNQITDGVPAYPDLAPWTNLTASDGVTVVPGLTADLATVGYGINGTGRSFWLDSRWDNRTSSNPLFWNFLEAKNGDDGWNRISGIAFSGLDPTNYRYDLYVATSAIGWGDSGSAWYPMNKWITAGTYTSPIQTGPYGATIDPVTGVTTFTAPAAVNSPLAVDVNCSLFTTIAPASDGTFDFNMQATGDYAARGTQYLYAWQLVIKLLGDASGDRTVDGGDLTILGQNWLGTGKTWEQGDFNGDGVVDGGDLTIMGQHWLQNGGIGQSFAEAMAGMQAQGYFQGV